jgi:hypothetical protein
LAHWEGDRVLQNTQYDNLDVVQLSTESSAGTSANSGDLVGNALRKGSYLVLEWSSGVMSFFFFLVMAGMSSFSTRWVVFVIPFSKPRRLTLTLSRSTRTPGFNLFGGHISQVYTLGVERLAEGLVFVFEPTHQRNAYLLLAGDGTALC